MLRLSPKKEQASQGGEKKILRRQRIMSVNGKGSPGTRRLKKIRGQEVLALECGGRKRPKRK